MFDITKPIGNEVVLFSIGFIFILVVIAFGVVRYYKNRLFKELK